MLARRTAVVADWAKAQGLDPARWAVYGADVVDAEAMAAAAAACIAAQGLPDTVVVSFGVLMADLGESPESPAV